MIDWQPNPDCKYKFDYARIFADIGISKQGLWKKVYGDAEEINELLMFRHLILNDLFFIVQFVLEIPPINKQTGLPFCNHPFVVSACRDVENGPKDYTLDIWAREHFKSSIITVAETIQYALKNPEDCQAILGYAAKPAKRFLFAIKQTFANKQILKACFPDVVWEDPEKEAPMWSLDDGIILKRKNNKPTPSIAAYGLIEGMPTGTHFERRVYDDIVTEDIADSPDVIEDVKMKFDSSQNLGTDGGTHRVVGTPYAHNDPLAYVRDKKDFDGKSKYHLRLKPATDDGTRSGKPVFLSQKRFEDLRGDKSFDCQQLLDPTPADVRKLDSKFLQQISSKFIPKNVLKFMLVDPAGDDKRGKGDAWAMGVFGVEPNSDDLGMSRVFICDAIVTPMREEEAPEEAARMYMRNGMIMQLGVEKVGVSTTEIHIANILSKNHRYISVDNGSMVILRPAGRDNKQRINKAVPWPLFNSKWFISDAVPNAYQERIKQEMDYHPAWHDDFLGLMAYLYDVIKDYRFGWFTEDQDEEPSNYRPQRVQEMGRSQVTGY